MLLLLHLMFIKIQKHDFCIFCLTFLHFFEQRSGP